ncbi:putative lysosomal protective protein precursor [Thozetella sp. PMI_491]|nr:putative lysosomal protective protein precursor [Thozetella sp. PMI_491]
MFAAALLCGLAGLAQAQFPPTPEGVKVLKSKFHPNVTISFKEPGICETTPGVKSYAGYVHLPPGFLDEEVQDYPVNTFFWFFEAREDPGNAPLAIWLNGGPGGSSMMGLLEENGPCLIEPDSKTTRLNPWSWNNKVNMLFIDQPTQVGFSYDIPTNVSVILDAEGEITLTPTDFTDGVPETNATHYVGTVSSQELTHTANTTLQAAHALWHFAQTWFFEFPYYKPADNRISLWAESYGGHYGPGFMRFFQEQNDKIANGSSTEKGAQPLHIDTLGIVNGLIDLLIQAEAYITFPYNNTYGVQVFNQSVYDELWHDWERPGGVKDQLSACQDSLKGKDITALRRQNKFPPEACPAQLFGEAVAKYQSEVENKRGWYDIGHSKYDPFPVPGMHGYLLDESVLGALGVPVNFSTSSRAVYEDFMGTNDLALGGFLDAVAYLLDSGVKVHMMYGDRDYACNWVGGEMASLAVPWSRSDEFAETGYAPLVTPDGFTGMTRQLGNFSFTRVFQAGHEVPSYQPIAAYEIFMRATFNKDIATGLLPVTDNLATLGPETTWHIKNIPPQSPEPKCYVVKPSTCPPDVWKSVVEGKAVVKDYFVVDEKTDAAGGISDIWHLFDDDQEAIADL